MSTPSDMPTDPNRPIPVLPAPAVVNCVPIEGMIVNGRSQTVLRWEIITSQGSAFAFMTPEQLLDTLPEWASLAQQAKTGLTIARSPLAAPNGHGPIR